MQTTSYSLGELLRRAKDQSLTIPQFQRKFIWRESQVKLLIDSMSRAYPIGSLLLLNKEPDLPLSSRSIEAEIRADYPPNDNGIDEAQTEGESYILDGQQRATSIARVFLNADPNKLYYFDLKVMFERHDKEEISWIRVRRRGKTEPDRKDNNRLLRADIVLNQAKTGVYVSEYIEDSGDFPEFENNKGKARAAAAQINGVFEILRNYKIPVVALERDSGVESVCRVFETINSTGTRLTTFDLAVARFYPKLDLRDLWENALKDYPILQKFEVDGERVLQTLFLAVAARNKKYPDPTRGNLLGLTRLEIEENWGRASKSLARTLKWAQDHGARKETLPSQNVLVALAAARNLFLDDPTGEPWEDHDFIRRWYFSKVIQAGASQASNYRIAQDFGALRQYVEDGVQPKTSEVRLDVNELLSLRPSDVRYKALQNLFATTIRHDLVTAKNINSESILQDHHIFPKIMHRRFQLPKQMLDSICNRMPLLAESNQFLNDELPKDYFTSLACQARDQGTLQGFCRRLRDCMIPSNPKGDLDIPRWSGDFSVEKFEEFCRKRADLILARVREVIGDSLRTNFVPEDELVEDDQ